MLRNRSDPLNLFDLVPQLSHEMDPEVTRLDRRLDDDSLFQRVRADLVCR